MVRKVLQLIALSLLLAACGTVATPAAEESIQETRIAEAATAAQQTADAPTLPPTETPEPTATVAPTETPEPTATDEATEEATEEVTEEATDEATEEATEAVDTESIGESDEIVGDAEAGQELFNQFVAEVNFACSTCHLPNSEQQLIGPGLLNIGTRAADRVEGQTANEYLHTAIVDPSAHVVEGFPDMLMPQTYEEILSAEDIDNLVAYLFTLTEE